jgi:hypothetical protein
MEQADLSEKERAILEYIKSNPGTTKQGVVDVLDGRYSRTTVFEGLKQLEKYGMIVIRKDKPNSQVHRLFINSSNLIITVVQDLDNFKAAFFILIEKAKKVFEGYESEIKKIEDIDIDIDSARKIENLEDELLDSIFSIHSHLINIYIVSASFTWNKVTNDKETLNKLYSIVFNKIQEIQLKISEVITIIYKRNDHVDFVRAMFSYPPAISFMHLEIMFHIFKRYKLENEFGPVMDLIWKISFDFIPFDDYSFFRRLKNKNKLKDWKWVLQVYSEKMKR